MRKRFIREAGHKSICLQRSEEIASVEFVPLLSFLHDWRILFHFDDTPILNNFVVLDHQWLINVFKMVITIKPYDLQEREFKELLHKLET